MKNPSTLCKWMFGIFFLFSFYFFLSTYSYAHSGRTDSSGGHNCRVGSCAGTYHYHNEGSGYGSISSYTPPIKTCGSNAYLSSNGECYCVLGYTAALNNIDCVVLPKNAHSVISRTDAWKCDYGYKESGNSCVEIQPENDVHEKELDRILNESIKDNKSEKEVDVTESSKSKSDSDFTYIGVIGAGIIAWMGHEFGKRSKS